MGGKSAIFFTCGEDSINDVFLFSLFRVVVWFRNEVGDRTARSVDLGGGVKSKCMLDMMPTS